MTTLTTSFDRHMLATLANLTYEGLASHHKRGLLPTFRCDRDRAACTPFDALVLQASEFFTRAGGLRRPPLSELIYQHLPELCLLAARIDAGERGLVLAVAHYDDDRRLVGGPFPEIAAELMRAADPPSRVTFVSLTGAAAAIRGQARAHGIGGDLRFAPSEAEVAKLAPAAKLAEAGSARGRNDRA
ncbi:MAG TPA: hypothetical protein VGG77_07645 [Roseiarcus sp.]|jgi:hypothetical protein